jgi:sulfite reductase alpha subunit-like flavoprotein
MEDSGLVTPWTVLAALLAASTAVALLVTHLVRKTAPLPDAKQASGSVRRTSSAAPQSYPNGSIDIYFGSQTGTAEGFAKALAREAGRYGGWVAGCCWGVGYVTGGKGGQGVQGKALNAFLEGGGVVRPNSIRLFDSAQQRLTLHIHPYIHTHAHIHVHTGFEGKAVDLETFEPEKLQATSLAVFLLATYGEGDPTDNAMQFAKWLKDEDGELSEQALGGLRFAVFGLGSTQYEHYNKMGKFAFQRLQEIGAVPVVELGLGDELTVEEDFEKWSEGLWGPLSRAAGEMGRSDSISIVEPLEASQTELDFSLLFLPKNGKPMVAKKLADAQIQASTKFFFHHHEVPVLVNRELRTPLDGGSTRHIELDLSGTGIMVRAYLGFASARLCFALLAGLCVCVCVVCVCVCVCLADIG